MKGTLVKEYGDFYLISDKEIGKEDEYVKLDNRPRTLLLGTTISHVTKVSKLSLKNCKAIEHGYDLDELAEKEFSYISQKNEINEFEHKMFINRKKTQFKVGFQKALELVKHRLSKETEWQVEVVMDKIPADLAPGGWDVFPKLDAENCLILKKIEC